MHQAEIFFKQVRMGHVLKTAFMVSLLLISPPSPRHSRMVTGFHVTAGDPTGQCSAAAGHCRNPQPRQRRIGTPGAAPPPQPPLPLRLARARAAGLGFPVQPHSAMPPLRCRQPAPTASLAAVTAARRLAAAAALPLHHPSNRLNTTVAAAAAAAGRATQRGPSPSTG